MAPLFGRKPPKNAPALMLSEFLSGTLPTVPPLVDHLNLGGWEMLGNDQYGDCVAVTWANERRLLTYHAGHENYPDLTHVETFYKTQNPNFPTDDNGMDIQTALEYLHTNGGPDGSKVVAFAKVDYTKPDQVKAAMAIFGCVWVGINVQQANMQQFDADQPWDYVAGSPIDGGHSIIVGGYDSDKVGGDEKFVTWAQETSFTDNYWSHQVEEAWVVIWPEHLTSQAFLTGVDQQALADAYKTLTGKTFPITPTPTPQPTPTPTPTPADPAAILVAVGEAWLNARYHSYRLNNELRTALQNWISTQ